MPSSMHARTHTHVCMFTPPYCLRFRFRLSTLPERAAAGAALRAVVMQPRVARQCVTHNRSIRTASAASGLRAPRASPSERRGRFAFQYRRLGRRRGRATLNMHRACITTYSNIRARPCNILRRWRRSIHLDQGREAAYLGLKGYKRCGL